MFDKEYSFRGKHAEMVKKLTAKFDDKNNQLFEKNINVYVIAPIVGFLYGKKSDLDKNSSETTKIFTDTLIKEWTNLKYNYTIITLLNNRDKVTLEERLDKAFRYYGTEKAKEDEDAYERYVLRWSRNFI